MNKANKNVLLLALTAFALLVAVYANHFNNGFHFDDEHAIVNNVHIRTLKNIPSFFSDPKMFSADPSHWGLRSIVTATLAVDYWLGGGLHPFYFQLSTFIWHVGLCMLLFFLYRNLFKTTFNDNWAAYLSLAAAALYGLHEANAETLNYIISRSDVISTFLIVLSLFLYISMPGKRKYYLYILPAFLGVFVKETMPVLIIILFFYILLFEKELSIADIFRLKNARVWLRVLLQMLPIIVVVAATQVYTLSRIKSIPGISNPLLPYVLTQSFVWVRYFIEFFLPVNLSADSDWSVIQNPFDERIIVGCIFVAGLVYLIFKTSSRAETKPVAFGLIWFAAALLPTSLAPFAEVTNDHRMYFPFIGLALSVIAYAGVLLKRYENIFQNKRMVSAASILLFCVIGLNAYGIVQRNKVWRNEESLWRDVSIKSPANGRGLMMYGVTQIDAGNYPMAQYYLKRAKVYSPYYAPVYVNLGVLASNMHKTADADLNFKTAIACDTTDFTPYSFYAKFLVDEGRIVQAQDIAERSLTLNPYSEKTLDILMNIYDETGQWDKLQNTAQQFLTILPGNKNAEVYLDAAKAHNPEVLHIDDKKPAHLPVTAADYLDLSLKYFTDGFYEKCIAACNQAIKLKPDYADAYSNMGAAYNKLNQFDDGIAACKKALAINPAHELANGNLHYAESQVNVKKSGG